MINERKLSSGEKSKLKKLEDKVPMKPFKDQYGDEGESVYYATLTKMAKENVMDPYDRLKLINEEIKKKLETKKGKPVVTADSFAKKYGVKATSPNLKELSTGKNAQRNPRRAAMAKALLDRM